MKRLLLTMIVMFILACNISIGANTYRQVNDVMIENDSARLDDRAIIKLPRISKVLADEIAVGDPVKIELAYSGVYSGTEFTGYVASVSPKIPVVVECEDPTYLMRRVNIKKAWKADSDKPIYLATILRYIVEQVNAVGLGKSIVLREESIPEIPFDKFRISDVTAARAIQELRDKYGLTAYFRGHELYVGFAYVERPGEVGYNLGLNVVEDKLTFRTADQVRMKVKATAILKDNKHISVEFGDDVGETRQLVFYDISDKAALEKQAQEEIQKYKYDGFEGSLKTFLIPYCTHGMTAQITSPNYPDKDGRYYVEKVTTSFGVNGARRDVKLGLKVS